MTYRRAIAAVLLALSLSACTPTHYVEVCPTRTEDSSTAHCTFDPAARYDYDRGAWRKVDSGYRYPNGNQPPTGEYLTAHPTPDE